MKKLIMMTFVTFFASFAIAQNGLFISEYVEGSSFNKAIEIVNGTGTTIDLSAYRIAIYSNGSATPTFTIPLDAVSLSNLDVFVLSHSSADTAILNAANQTSGSLSFNGNDVVSLQETAGTNIDVIGQIGVDPGTEWGSGLTSTQNNTLRRKSSVNTGDPDGSNAFDPAGEWDGFAQDTFDGLGSHTIDNPLPVELTSFTYSVIDGIVKLIWTTATEMNNYGFQIERRKITDAWQSIGFVEGKGTTTEPQYYEFVDVSEKIGNYDYRLKQIDTDGSFEYSQVLSIFVSGPVTTRLAQNHPNPFNPSTTITFAVPEAGEVKLAIYNLRGQLIQTLHSGPIAVGQHSVVWDGTDFRGAKVASGIYLYKLQAKDFVATRKLVFTK